MLELFKNFFSLIPIKYCPKCNNNKSSLEMKKEMGICKACYIEESKDMISASAAYRVKALPKDLKEEILRKFNNPTEKDIIDFLVDKLRKSYKYKGNRNTSRRKVA